MLPSSALRANNNGTSPRTWIAVAHDTTPYISVYPWTGAFGTKVTNPATLPTGAGYGVPSAQTVLT